MAIRTMPTAELWAGALSLLLIHGETGCPHSALNAIRLLDRLCDMPGVDDATRGLCERASARLSQRQSEGRHAFPPGGRPHPESAIPA